MNDNYSVKINRVEGTVEISGGDKDWVADRLAELKDVLTTQPVPAPKGSIPTNPTTATITPQKTRKKSSNGSSRASKNPDLIAKLDGDIKGKLVSYVRERQTNFDKSLPAQAAIIATFLQDELEWPGVDQNDMYTVYSVMGWPAPGNPRSQLNNAYVRNQYFEGMTDGKYTLSHKGENYARHDSKTAGE